MRMRKKKHGMERIQVCSHLFVPSPQKKLPEWGSSPVSLEIGCGKGSFILQMAKQYPAVSFVAMEKISDVIVHAMEKTEQEKIQNIQFINGDAKDLPRYFKKGDVQCIYLNFSDPWKKANQAKRRLTSKKFLEIYKCILPINGMLIFKTDNRHLFDFSLEQLQENGFRLEDINYDVHNSPYAAENIMTEYETIFSQKGFPIHRVVAYLTDETPATEIYFVGDTQSDPMVKEFAEKRNLSLPCMEPFTCNPIAPLQSVLQQYAGERILLECHETAWNTIRKYYDNAFREENFMHNTTITPWIVKFTFHGETCVAVQTIEKNPS